MADVPASPLDSYHGRKGYARMMQELRDSFYEQMPWAKGRIEIVNPLNDPKEELARINASLGLTGDYTFQELPHGQDFDRNVPGKGFISVAGGWEIKPGEEITPQLIFEHAATLVHEIGHALIDRHEDVFDAKSKSVQTGMADTNQFSEAFADTMRQAMALRNFHDQTDSIKSMAANYDTHTPTSNYSATGSFLENLLQRHAGQENPSDTNYHLKGWNEAYQESLDVFRNTPVFKPEAAVQMNIMMRTEDREIIDHIVRDMEPKAGDIRKAYHNAALRDIVTEVFQNPFDDSNSFLRQGAEIPDSLKGTGFVEKIRQGIDEKLQWLGNNRDILGDYAQRQIDGYNYLLHRSNEFRPKADGAPHDTTIQEFFAKTLLKYDETGRPEYLQDAKSSAKVNDDETFVAVVNDPAKFNYLATHSDILRLMADGTKYQDINMPSDFPRSAPAPATQSPAPAPAAALTPVSP